MADVEEGDAADAPQVCSLSLLNENPRKQYEAG